MRCKDTFIGRYEIAEPFGIVVPEDPAIPYDIFTLRRDAPSVQEGDIVEVQIQEFPTRTSAATEELCGFLVRKTMSILR